MRPPAPCRPSKLRFDVDAQRSPGERMSGFMPRHIEQPARRHSKPARSKTSRSPSSSACRFTRAEPGTTIACTPSATRRPATTCGGGAQVLDARVRARADEDLVDADVGERRARREVHVAQRALDRVALVGVGEVGRIGHDAVDRQRPCPGSCPT